MLFRSLEVAPQSYQIRGLGGNNIAGAIIPALMHRIPSELRSKAWLGESSTRMGDLLGSPRVAPLFPFYDGLSMIYVRTCRANWFCPSHFHPDPPIMSYQPSKSIVADFPRFVTRESFPHFKTIDADTNLFRAPRPKL